MKIFSRYFYLFILLISSWGCKEKFTPELKEPNERLLVVEGLIRLGAERTTITLSRTIPISQQGNRAPESGATVSIESNSSEVYTLVEKTNGVYESAVLNLDPNKKYRLRIISKGNEYMTDFLEAKVSPAIQDIAWEAKSNGLQIFLNTQDNTNKTRYYRWDFEETWAFYAQYSSAFVWAGSSLRLRDRNTEDIYKCWGNTVSSAIVLGTSIKLNDDVIHQQPITLIPYTSEKLTEKYSILVKQYALTKEAFDFWESLRKNTESLGSIFDALPSQLTGNIKNIKNPAEPVLGYISVGSVQSRRIFISKGDFPNWNVQPEFNCKTPDTIALNKINIFADPNYVPLQEVVDDLSGRLIGYTGTTRKCGDCTTRGTNKKPSFWP